MSISAEQTGAVSLVANISFAAVKIIVGVAGASYALIADGIESLADCVSSLVVWNGLRFGAKEADEDHPYGHGKAEALAGFLAGLGLLGSAVLIAVQASQEMMNDNNTSPAFFTVPTLILIIFGKEMLFRFVRKSAIAYDSTALKAEAWHHRSDSLTSLGVLVGVCIAVFGGERFSIADDVAALLVSGLIVYNGLKIIKPSVDELMDRRVYDAHYATIQRTILETAGVQGIETLLIRRSGRAFLIDVHIEVDADISVRSGHDIAHNARDRLQALEDVSIGHVHTHVEPTNAKGEVPTIVKPKPEIRAKSFYVLV